MSAQPIVYPEVGEMMKRRESKVEAIVIGASAGGITALLSILAPLPKVLRLPIVVVLHLAEDNRGGRLVDVFSHHLEPRVRFAEDKDYLASDTVYFAAPGYHLSIEKERWFSLSREEPRHFSRPSIDYLMMSAAEAYPGTLLGILLTGASEDGAEGMASIRRAGGFTVVQNPADAEFDIMPRAAIRLCEPDGIYSLQQIRALIYFLETPDVG